MSEEVKLTEAEEWVLALVWAADAIGISICLNCERFAAFKPTADALVARELLYRVRADLSPEDDPEDAGYSFTTAAVLHHAEKLYDRLHRDYYPLVPWGH